jgi:hypothetical protein
VIGAAWMAVGVYDAGTPSIHGSSPAPMSGARSEAVMKGVRALG